MSGIKNLKSGVVPCNDPGNSILPSGTNFTLEFGQLDHELQMQQQANRTMVVTEAQHSQQSHAGIIKGK